VGRQKRHFDLDALDPSKHICGFLGRTKDSRRWIIRKGVHLRDRSKAPVSAKPLTRKPFVPITALSTVAPLLHPDLLETWPKNQETVANISDELLEVFDGPRVLFPDGFSRLDHSIRAVFYEETASFTHSVGVIKGPQEDRIFCALSPYICARR
jgi:hypothetical protein